MSNSPLSSQDIRAAAQTHDELGTEYGDAVVESFLDRVDKEIAARVDAHLATGGRVPQPRPAGSGTLAKGIAVGMAISGVPLLAALFVEFKDGSGLTAIGWLVAIWLIMAMVTTANAVRTSRPRRRPGQRAATGRP